MSERLSVLGYHLAQNYAHGCKRFEPLHENTGTFRAAITETHDGQYHGWASVGAVSIGTRVSRATPEEAAADLERGLLEIADLVAGRVNVVK